MFQIRRSPDARLYRVFTAPEDPATPAPIFLDKGAGINMAGYRWLVVTNFPASAADPVQYDESGMGGMFTGVATWNEALGMYIPTGFAFDSAGQFVYDAMGQTLLLYAAPNSGAFGGKRAAVMVSAYNNPDQA